MGGGGSVEMLHCRTTIENSNPEKHGFILVVDAILSCGSGIKQK